MANDDGSVRIKVDLDGKGVQRGVAELRKTLLALAEGTKLEGTFSRLDSVGCKAFDSIGKAAKVGMKAAAAGAAATVTSIAAVGKQALDAYAKYEQMVGGVDKLFGTGAASTVEEYAEQVGKSVDKVQGEFNKLQKASQTVQKNAEAAYKTAGMSANSYMESVTGFSAALINSLGGDTTKAAKQADVAMRAISDNANTFGTDTETIVQTYQSLARGNYAMLDNLKLGYGGTKTELERLVSDANKYAAANKDVAKEVGVSSKLQVSSFSDVVSAIELIQRKQQIAGTTAREAATTIEGSVNSMQAAWENWVTELGKDDADISKTTTRLVKSAVTAASNVIPRVAEIMTSMGEAIGKQLPRVQKMLAKQFSKMDFGSMLKSLQSGASGILEGISSVVSSIDWTGVASSIANGIAGVVQSAADYIRTNGAYILAGVADVAQQVVVGIAQAAPSILAAVGNIAVSIGDSIANIGIAAKLATDESLQAVKQSVSDTAKAVEESTTSWDKVRESTTKAGDAAESTYGHYEGLVAQLDNCVTASGKVRKGHEDEAETIVSILNDALGTNMSVRDGVIDKYKDQREELQKLIDTKKAESLAEAYGDQYQSAVTGKADALKNYAQAQKDVNAAQDEYNKKLQAYNEESAKVNDSNAFDHSKKMAELKEAMDQSKTALDTAQQTYDAAKGSYTEMEKTVSTYEEAQAKLAKGDYSGAIDGFNSLSDAAAHSSSEIAGMSDNSEKLSAMAENIALYADQMSLAVGSGVDESKKQLEQAVIEYAQAGGDMGDALAGGIKDSSGKVKISASEVQKVLKKELSAKDYLKAIGKDAGTEYADGVGSTASTAQQRAEDVAESAGIGLESADGTHQGNELGGDFTDALKKNASKARASGSAVSASAGSGLKSNNGSASTWGAHLVENFASGISSMAGAVSSAVGSIASNIKAVLHHTTPDEGPLKDDDKWGGHFVDNIANGISKNASKAEKAALGLAEGIMAALSTADTDKAVSAVSAKMQKRIDKATTKAVKKAGTAGKKTVSAFTKQLSKLQSAYGKSAAVTAAFWKSAGDKAKDGSKVQEQCYAKMEKAAKKYAESLSTLGEQKSYYTEHVAALKEEVAASQKAYDKAKKHVQALKEKAKACKDDSDAQEKAQKAYEKANAALEKQADRLKTQKERLSDSKAELKEIKQSIKEAAQTAKDELFGVADTSTKTTAEIKSNLQETITSLMDTYTQAVESTKSSITSSLGFFKEFTSEATGSIETLIANQLTQEDAAKRYAAVWDTLKARVGDSAGDFYSYLQQAGISSLADLETIASATEDQLQKLVDSYNATQRYAEQAAVKLNEDTYKETVDGINKAWSEANDEMQKSYQAYADTMSELGKKVSASVKAQYEAEFASIQALAAGALEGEGSIADIAAKYAETFDRDISGLMQEYAAYTTSAMEAAQKATEESVNSQTETVKTGTTLITRTVQTAMDSQYSAVSGTMSAMESRVQSTVSSIASMMSQLNAMESAANAAQSSTAQALAYAKSNSNSGTNLASAASVNWYAAGGIFNSPQVIGIGEAGTEYALRDYHLDAIAERMQGNQQADFDAAITKLARALPSIIKSSTPDSISVNKREFGRLVREV